MAKFGSKQWINPFGKMTIFRFFELLVFIAQKGFFSLQNIVKDIFLAYIALKKIGLMAIFGPKPWVNPFGKMSIYRLFKVRVFMAQKGVFFALEYRQIHFPVLYCLKKKKLEKWPFLDQIHGLPSLEKCQFCKVLNLLVLQPRKALFFSIEYRQRHFPGLYCLKKKVGKQPFLD